jgi:hypothetical protein
MPSSEVEQFFKKYVLPPRGLIYQDIKQQIDLSRSAKTVNGLLVTLGLISYTEFMGKILLKNDGSYTKQFRSFFRLMGEEYARLIDNKEIDIYAFFRSGLLQSYLSGNCEIRMSDEHAAAGIILQDDGSFVFIVEKYFEDFLDACRKLQDDMLADPDIYLPF